MEDIEKLAIQRYHKNIEYFETSHPNILKLLNALNIAFEKGDLEPHYNLEYIENYFDVKDLYTGSFLYASNSNTISKEFAKRVNFRKNSYVYDGLPVYHSSKVVDMETDITRGLDGVYPIIIPFYTNSKKGMKIA